MPGAFVPVLKIKVFGEAPPALCPELTDPDSARRTCWHVPTLTSPVSILAHVCCYDLCTISAVPGH